VFGTVGRRAIESVVVVFALLGYGFVPLGSKTAFEHTVALFRTAPAAEAAAGFIATLEKGRALLARALAPDAPEPGVALPLPSAEGVTPGAPKLSGGSRPRQR
jgi:hypothetical protein